MWCTDSPNKLLPVISSSKRPCKLLLTCSHRESYPELVPIISVEELQCGDCLLLDVQLDACGHVIFHFCMCPWLGTVHITEGTWHVPTAHWSVVATIWAVLVLSPLPLVLWDLPLIDIIQQLYTVVNTIFLPKLWAVITLDTDRFCTELFYGRNPYLLGNSVLPTVWEVISRLLKSTVYIVHAVPDSIQVCGTCLRLT